MSFVKYLLPALAATQLAFADSKCGDTKIETQSDADGLNSCSTVKGDISVSSDFSGSLSLSGVEKIDGDLTVNNATQLTSFSADSVSEITGTFKLASLTTLSNLAFPKLDSVGSLDLKVLPALESLGFDTGVTSAGDVYIYDTKLGSLDGISLETVGAFDIENNRYLKTVNVNNLKNATGDITFASNYDALEIELPNLGDGKNLTCRNISSISVPSLKKLSGSLGFYGTDFKSFIAPNLTSTGDLVFMNNKKLSNISMARLEKVNGGFQIARNDKLQEIDLPKLERVTGAIDFSGKFNTVEFGSLKEVSGGFNLQSTDGKFNCDTFDKMKNDIIHGKYNCDAKKDNPTTSNGKSGTSSSSSSSSGSSSTSSGAAVVNSGSVSAAGIATVFYAIAQLF
ncbi:Protein ecm33 [Penicillium citrinum]|uniref:Protein ecm33 n=1 Tax=Penicillium citrinum TaxID=5077 RepID=A0A9W9NZS3_PENCI|nr:Protein ecm33 [Penicillium citrinum]KAJ5231567.1 Protein ecm33 [Penicillium citrinum]